MEHANYLSAFFNPLPSKFAVLSTQKALMTYFIVTTLEYLKLDYDKQKVLEMIKRLEHQQFIYKQSDELDSEGSIVACYCIVAVLKQMGHQIQGNQHHLQFVEDLITKEGQVKQSYNSFQTDLRMVYSALAYLSLIGLQLKEQHKILIVEHIWKCQNPDGGFGLSPFGESNGGATYLAIASLKLLGQDPFSEKLVEWIAMRQHSNGGIQGRVNKIPDSCYSFWVGWSAKILNVDFFNKEKLKFFLNQCKSEHGGFSKYPDCKPDPVHTLHALFGMQQMKATGAGSFDVIFAAPDTLNEQYSRFSLRAWWIVMQANKDKPFRVRMNLYERAFKYIPNCYKLWFNFLKEQLEDLQGRSTILSPRYENMMILFERALVYMHKMPNIWLMYADYCASINKITQTRWIFDRALESLPVTQHHRIWERYCQWVSTTEAIQTAHNVFKRFLKVNPDYKEEYVDYLVSKECWDLASSYLVDILNDDGYNSATGRTKYEFMQHLCEIISSHPDQIKSIDPTSIIKFGIKKYSDEIGQLWIKLADYHIKIGLYENARDIFEEGVNNVLTVKDFALVYNAYVKFEEQMIKVLEMDDKPGDEIDDTPLIGYLNKTLNIQSSYDEVIKVDDEILMKIDRLQELLDRRPLLLNSCMLRQNKYNVQEWLNRIELVKKDERMALKTFTDALEIVEPKKADNGKLSDIWVAYGRYYKEKGDYKTCNQIFSKGVVVEYKQLDEYVNIWSQWAEMLLNDGFVNDAIVIIQQALFKKYVKKDDKSPISMVPFSLDIWELYIDLEKNFGNFKTLRAAYKRMVELKVVTPFVIINYAQLLEDNTFYEESFKVFETGISLFAWPALYELWIIYITKFIERYKGYRLERARNLFETVLEQVPKEKCRIFYLMYGEFEEQYGLLNHAIEIYDRMVYNVDYNDKMEAYNIYIAKVAMYLGITKTRQVFENAIEVLQEAELIQMGLRLAQLERKFGEIDRARAVYIHISQYSDPRYDDFGLWQTWENFELHHGNEDTYKEYRRISKSVVAKFSLMPPDPSKVKERVDKGYY